MPEFTVRVTVEFQITAESEDEALDIACQNEGDGEFLWDAADVEESP